MTYAYAYIDGATATADELADAVDERDCFDQMHMPRRRSRTSSLKVAGSHKGEILVTGPHTEAHPVDSDFGPVYRAALDALLASDDRIRTGSAFSLGIFH